MSLASFVDALLRWYEHVCMRFLCISYGLVHINHAVMWLKDNRVLNVLVL